jgi:DNA-binding XRE family transcriptional regulator
MQAVSTTKKPVVADRATLKAARVRLGMEQEQLAQAAGIARATLSFFENGKKEPHDSTRLAIQTALELRGIVFTNGDRPGFYFDTEKATITSK